MICLILLTKSFKANLYLANAALFFSYGLCQKGVAKLVKKQNVKKLTPTENGLAGAGAAIAASLVLCPAELVKCRLQAAREMKKSTLV